MLGTNRLAGASLGFLHPALPTPLQAAELTLKTPFAASQAAVKASFDIGNAMLEGSLQLRQAPQKLDLAAGELSLPFVPPFAPMRAHIFQLQAITTCELVLGGSQLGQSPIGFV